MLQQASNVVSQERWSDTLTVACRFIFVNLVDFRLCREAQVESPKAMVDMDMTLPSPDAMRQMICILEATVPDKRSPGWTDLGMVLDEMPHLRDLQHELLSGRSDPKGTVISAEKVHFSFNLSTLGLCCLMTDSS